MLANFASEKGGYIKVLIALLALTAITFTIPVMNFGEMSFGLQMLVGTIKAWVILLYYMHLKGEKLIGWTVVFAVFIVAFFFSIVMIDVFNFQFADVSHITAPAAAH